jgi:hypothetical protein
MKIADAKRLVPTLLRSNMRILLTGEPGIGKSQVFEESASELNLDYVPTELVFTEPADVKGLAMPVTNGEGTEAVFLPIGDVRRLLSASEPTLWNLEDLIHAAGATLFAVMHAIHGRSARLAGRPLPPCVQVVATTNSVSDGGAVRPIPPAVVERFHQVLHVEPDFETWLPWATVHGIDPRIIAFLSYCESFQQSRFHEGIPADRRSVRQIASPRSWSENLQRLLETGLCDRENREFSNARSETVQELVAGAVGPVAAAEFVAFLEALDQLVPVPEILAAPLSARIPPKLSVLTMTLTGLAQRLIR